MNPQNIIRVGLAQLSPVWLNREKTTEKIVDWIVRAGREKCDLVAFGEALLPGYPFWVELTNSPEFNSPVQKTLFSAYARQAVCIEKGDLDSICKAAVDQKTAVYLGIIERPTERGGHSLYCSLVYIDKGGQVQSVHRKLMPTYEERLVWSIGDGNGLQVHPLEQFTVGGLNCWENWMPLPRTSLYAMGENVHVAVWPGSDHNTRDITRFIARESRSYMLSVSALMSREDITDALPHARLIRENSPEILTNGGSCIAGPDGEWIVEPQIGSEKLITAELHLEKVFEERQNFDPSGHYSRPDVFSLSLNKERQKPLSIK